MMRRPVAPSSGIFPTHAYKDGLDTEDVNDNTIFETTLFKTQHILKISIIREKFRALTTCAYFDSIGLFIVSDKNNA